MVANLSSKSRGQPVFGARSAAMISISRPISREGVMTAFPSSVGKLSDPSPRRDGAARLLINGALGVPIPKFAQLCGALVCELRNQTVTGMYLASVALVQQSA